MATAARPATVVAAAAASLPRDGAARPHPGRWGMWLVVATEAAFFAYLLFSYFYLASSSRAWPPSGAPDLTLAGPNTVILLVSSATLWWGERGIRQGHQARLRIGLLLTLLLGAAFLVIQGVEYSHKSFTPETNAYGSAFFTITGFHGLHVFVGLLMNVVVQIWAWGGHFSAERHMAVSNASLYWHFVDAVWIAVFTSLYLVPHLG